MAESSANDESGIYVEPSAWYTDPDLSVFYSEPDFDEKEAAQLVKAWIVKQGRSWPMALDALTLTEMSRLVYVPYLLLSAKVSFCWSGTAEETRTRRGSRQASRTRSDGTTEFYSVPTTETYTVTYPVSGTVSEAPVDLNASDTKVQSARCGLPDFEKAAENAANVSEFDGDQLLLLQPQCRTAQDVDGALYDHMIARLDRQGPSMVNRTNLVKFSATSVDVITKASWVHLYPVIQSSYRHRDSEYSVQIDGHTRHVHVDVPWTVRLNRRLRRLAAVAGFLMCLAGAWWMTARDDGAGSGGSAATPASTPTAPLAATDAATDAAPQTQQGERALGLDRPTRRRIQSGLLAAGFDAGPADGQFGSRTRRAIRAWQSARGDPASSYLYASEAEELANLGTTAGTTAEGRVDAER